MVPSPKETPKWGPVLAIPLIGPQLAEVSHCSIVQQRAVPRHDSALPLPGASMIAHDKYKVKVCKFIYFKQAPSSLSIYTIEHSGRFCLHFEWLLC